MRALVKPPPLGVRAPPVPRRRGGEGGCVQGGNALRRAEGERDGRGPGHEKRKVRVNRERPVPRRALLGQAPFSYLQPARASARRCPGGGGAAGVDRGKGEKGGGGSSPGVNRLFDQKRTTHRQRAPTRAVGPPRLTPRGPPSRLSAIVGWVRDRKSRSPFFSSALVFFFFRSHLSPSFSPPPPASSAPHTSLTMASALVSRVAVRAPASVSQGKGGNAAL